VSSRVDVRSPRPDDAEAFLVAMRASIELHHPWTKAPLTRPDYDAMLERAAGPTYEPLLIVERESGLIAGYVALSEVVRGSFQNAFMGYYGTAQLTGRGLMTEGILGALEHGFSTMGLHRIEANVQPGNERSLALARRVGFRLEGFSPRYLNIGGVWCDHERYAMTVEDWHAR
jgi:ribosomal-protein-alanine N-acetyltransferase